MKSGNFPDSKTPFREPQDTNNKPIPPSIFNAFNICPRQAWLMSRNLTADQQSSYLEIGRLINDTTFTREKKKIFLSDIHAAIDLVTKKDGEYYIGEIKKSSRTLNTGVLQLKYYLYLLKKEGLNFKGIIKIPKEKISREIVLTEQDIEEIEKTLDEMKVILSAKKPPKVKSMMRICKVCAHFEFCWS